MMTPEEQIAKLTKDLEKAKAAAVEWETKATEAAAVLETTRHENTVALALIGKGITDPDDRDAILARYAKVPDAPDFNKWFDKATKGDRIVSRIVADAAPKVEAPPEAPEGDKTPPADAAPKGPKPPPPTAAGGKADPATSPKSQTWTAERIRGASIDEIRKNIDAIRRGE